MKATKIYRARSRAMVKLARRYRTMLDNGTASPNEVPELSAMVQMVHLARAQERASGPANDTTGRVPHGIRGVDALLFDVDAGRAGAMADRIATLDKVSADAERARAKAEQADHDSLMALCRAAVANVTMADVGDAAAAVDICGCDSSDAWECGTHRRKRLTRERMVRLAS